MHKDCAARLIVAAALAGIAPPAMASDYRGAFTAMFGMPFLMVMALLLGMLVTRRMTASQALFYRGVAVICLGVAGLLSAWLLGIATLLASASAPRVSALMILFVSVMALPLVLVAISAKWVWRAPRGRLARVTSHVLAVLAVLCFAACAIDLYSRLIERFPRYFEWPTAIPLLLLAACIGLYGWAWRLRRERAIAP